MINNPLVSILVPLYNAEKYFEETIESLLNQTYKNIEIIIVNDGSTDNSLKLAKEYENLYSNIFVFNQENSGAASTRNNAFNESKGDYIQYFDADDIMHPDKISSQMNVLRKYNFQDDIVTTGKWVRFSYNIENFLYIKKSIEKNYDDTLFFLEDAWRNSEYFIGPSWLISRKLNEKVGGWSTDLTFNDDGEFFTRVAYNSSKILYVNDSLVYYRQDNQNSISSDFSIKSIRSHLKSLNLYEECLGKDIEKNNLRYATAKLYSNFYRFHFPVHIDIKKEVYSKLKKLGYKEPLIKFNPKISWIVKIFGVDIALYLRWFRDKLVT
ncbi:MAG: glycosyltransferase [Epsilonproteobacteria bacterium]|nr:glycosyltransferase [Campylobacterota bacterium]